MPVFEFFDGITISVFSRDHLPPHCHVQYAEYEALINIRTAEVVTGHLPPKQLKKALTYVRDKINQAELLDAFYQLNLQIKRL